MPTVCRTSAGVTIGPWAYGLAAVGTLAGGVLGATAIEPGAPTESWLGGRSPVPVRVRGRRGAAIVMAMNGRDRLARQFFWGSMVTGISAGLLAASSRRRTSRPGAPRSGALR